MKLKVIILAFAITPAFNYAGKSQCLNINLIKNPSLEEFNCCPKNVGMIYCSTYWSQNIIGGSSSEYFNICGLDSLDFPNLSNLFQHNYFGNGYAGIYTLSYNPHVVPPADYREYINGTLSEPLLAGQCYYCEFWVLLWNCNGEVSFCGSDALGAYFSDTLPLISDTEPMAMIFPSQINNPTGRIITDTNNWTKISGTFTAVGGEEFFTVGNFWQISDIHCIYFGNPPFDRSYYFFDNFSLCPCSDTLPPEGPSNTVYLPNIFSPNNDGQNDFFSAKGEHISQLELKVYSRWGNLVFESNDPTQGWDGRSQGKDCAEGVYFYSASVTFTDGVVEVKTGNVTMVR